MEQFSYYLLWPLGIIALLTAAQPATHEVTCSPALDATKDAATGQPFQQGKSPRTSAFPAGPVSVAGRFVAKDLQLMGTVGFDLVPEVSGQ